MRDNTIQMRSPSISIQKPLIVCLSHLRWNFVFQRPQQLLSRAAKYYQVIYIEEPIFESRTEPTARIEISSSVGSGCHARPALDRLAIPND